MEKSDIVVWYHGLWVDAISGESWVKGSLNKCSMFGKKFWKHLMLYYLLSPKAIFRERELKNRR